MARSTKAEIEHRLAEVGPMVCDCMTLREVRAWVDVKTTWGPTVSDSTLKYYMKRAREQMRSEAAALDCLQERGVSKRRLERIIARSAAKGDLRTELAADRQLRELLGTAVSKNREPVDATAALERLTLEVAQDIADHESRDEVDGGIDS
jgi:predicted metal-dependent hydrolase